MRETALSELTSSGWGLQWSDYEDLMRKPPACFVNRQGMELGVGGWRVNLSLI